MSRIILAQLHIHHVPRALVHVAGTFRGFQQLQAVAQRCERVAQLVGESREELVFAPIHGIQRVRVRAGLTLAVSEAMSASRRSVTSRRIAVTNARVPSCQRAAETSK